MLIVKLRVVPLHTAKATSETAREAGEDYGRKASRQNRRYTLCISRICLSSYAGKGPAASAGVFSETLHIKERIDSNGSCYYYRDVQEGL